MVPCQTLVGRWLLSVGATSNWDEITCTSTWTFWAAVLATVARYVSCSTMSLRSTPFFPRDVTISCSFWDTIS